MEPIDTNVLVRHFTGAPVGQAQAASRLLKEASAGAFLLTDVHLSEMVWVLETSTYKAVRSAIVAAVEATLALPAIRVDDEAVVREAVRLYSERTMDWTDAYLVATGIERRSAAVVSFDHFDAKIKGLSVSRREPR